ncbi:MAG TPA: cardiolipin synthase [Cyclobacteriaceae bacterium]|nr:cardiolipin synthase [Cyclobacteriaceae bacterium]
MWFTEAKWIILIQVLYTVILVACCLRIVYDTRSVSKTLAYLLFAVFVPVAGIAFYFSFGINYRKRKLYNKKLIVDETVKDEFQEFLKKTDQRISTSNNGVIRQYQGLIRLLSNRKIGSISVLPNNEIKLLINGEALFPVLIEELQKAEQCIHIEYYIYENDTIGNRIKDILIQKAKAGVKVRFIYDDFGSRSIRNTIVRELTRAGVQAHPFNKIRLIGFANRLNYRNHRKIVVIDGKTSFTGGINVSDRYINQATSDLFWRDTHLMIRGYSSLALQQVFLADWNFCVKESVLISKEYFPAIDIVTQNPAYAQVVSSGPDSDLPNILYSIIQSVNLAREEILLTTPYYIPDVSLQESLVMAALSGVKVKLLVPKQGDSKLVNLATQSYFDALLRAGVKIYLYKKGFVHAKTFVVDRRLASVSTANFDVRSFDLNFEVSVIMYDEKMASQLADAFDNDVLDAEELVLERWNRRSRFRKITERIVRLFSPFM